MSVPVATTAAESFVAVLVAAMVYLSLALLHLNGAALQVFAIQRGDCGLAFFRNGHFHKSQSV
jgi:hypothetical protein